MLKGETFFIAYHQQKIDAIVYGCMSDLCGFINDADGQAENIPGISSAHLADLRTVLHENDQRVMQLALECISKVPRANYLLLTTVQELEAETIESLKAIFPFPVYPIGPAISYLELN